ncbi:glycoside hydrolase family 6 protein [Streptomyces sp. BA2]|uniref:glycoside hydrolase family 6 protein n=1 Tax=Streptomyces sp. BA2 TaxID=436595 RepID=UPI003014F8BF
MVGPDTVAQKIAGCARADAEERRYGLRAYAVDRLTARPRTGVCLDTGNRDWIPDENRLVAPLRQAGVAGSDGFAVNISSYQTNAAGLAYGHRVIRALGCAIGDQSWCNPPGHALGTPPITATATGDPALDAYLWIKRPGESDGTCGGGPRAGAVVAAVRAGLASGARGEVKRSGRGFMIKTHASRAL